jgi:hypothetical protein
LGGSVVGEYVGWDSTSDAYGVAVGACPGPYGTGIDCRSEGYDDGGGGLSRLGQRWLDVVHEDREH